MAREACAIPTPTATITGLNDTGTTEEAVKAFVLFPSHTPMTYTPVEMVCMKSATGSVMG
jgi:hypothetical protein